MVSFDVKSLFTNVSLDNTIDIVLKRIYDKNEIKTTIPRDEMRKLLILCTKSVQFMFNEKFYFQLDSVAMGSPLGSVIANILMVELEQTLVPQLQDH